MNFDLSLYLVTDRTLLHGKDLVETVEQAVQAGVTMVQLREKDCSTARFVALAERLKHLLKPFGVPLIINDRIDVALAVDADGVHIGQNDMPYEMARRLLGHDKIIGLSVENLQQVRDANNLDVDYIGISPVFATDTKIDTARPFGLDGLREAICVSVHPTVAIGGMNEQTIPAVMDCGVNGVALVSAIIASSDVRSATDRLRSLIYDRWSRHVWNLSASVFSRIIRHPFIQELASGRLASEKFGRYIAQDELYLGNYGRQMFQLADMIDDGKQRDMFRSFAQAGLEGEKAMHELLISRLGIEAAPNPSSVTIAYNAHTQAALDSGSKELALAAMLPCMWIYNEVGLYILRIARMDGNPYREWIQEYGNEEFTEGVRAVVELIDEWVKHVDEATRQRMAQNYLEAAQFEYDFWNYGYYEQ